MNDDVADLKKDKDFLTQIPDWEKTYKEPNTEKVINFKKEDWHDAPATFTKHDLKIFGYSVMEDWETPYMKALSDICASKGGIVLEVGYGMGISAKFIQEHPISKHLIIEANKEVCREASVFAKKAKHKVEILCGLWEDMIQNIPDESLDGILFDTYPLEERELYQNHFGFFPYAYRKLKIGGVFTYYSDEIDTFTDVHIRQLESAGFSQNNITGQIVKIQPPPDCEYWKANTMLAPIIIK